MSARPFVVLQVNGGGEPTLAIALAPWDAAVCLDKAQLMSRFVRRGSTVGIFVACEQVGEWDGWEWRRK